MNWLQVAIMWCGIVAILVLGKPRLAECDVYLFFWEYVLVVTLLTVGFIFTIGAATSNRQKG